MIRLKSVRLINWYGFSRITVPMGSFTLIAGRNGNGKSVFLDAIKYALYGDTVFNNSNENKGSRTISSYTRGLLDATANTWIRPADKVPNVYTHIVLEMHEEEIGRSFLLGTVIETDSANACRASRYVMENKTLSDVEHTDARDGGEFPLSAARLQERYGLHMLNVENGLLKFMQRTGLRFNEQQLKSFRWKLRSIMAYDPRDKVDQFIRRRVLEEKKIDFSKLIEAKNNIDRLNASFAAIDAEIQELDEILGLFAEKKNAQNILLSDDVRLVYRQILQCEQAEKKAKTNMETAQRQLQENEAKLETVNRREAGKRDAYYQAKHNLASMDCAKAIVEAEEELKKASQEREVLRKEKEQLETLQTKVSELIAWLEKEREEENYRVPEEKLLSALTADTFSSAQKKTGTEVFRAEVSSFRDVIVARRARIHDDLQKNDRLQEERRKTIRDCEEKRAVFSEIPDYVALKNEINREFQKRGIRSQARFACEYVLGIRDEAWRDAIEGYLGRRRYTILVEPEVYDIADDVLNASGNRYAHLFNTKLLMKKKVKITEDSIFKQIEVKNPAARQYFAYQLGRFHAVPKEQVKNFENAISKEGRVSVAMDSYFLNFDRIRFYCLGQQALELNRQKAENDLKKLKAEAQDLHQAYVREKEKLSYLDTALKFFGEYNYDACSAYPAKVRECARKEAELAELKEAQKNNLEFMELAARVETLARELAAIGKERDALYADSSAMQTQYDTNKTGLEKAKREGADAAEKMGELKVRDISVCERATADYDRYLKNGAKGPGGILKDRGRAERRLQESTERLQGSRLRYNLSRSAENQLFIAGDSPAPYRERRERIWMDDREEIRTKLKEQTRRYEDIFKNEFVLTVLKSCESSRMELKRINRELAALEFKAKYEFDVKYVKDGSDYEKILEYAKYLKEREELGTEAGQMTLDAMTAYSDDRGEKLEKEIHQIINRIVENNDKGQIEKYADYRNYMTYEILLTNDVLTRAKLSRQSGYNSGAEVQIPYLLILLSALLMIYDEKSNSTRLVFIDEPFAKMDPANVRIMLGFMKKQNLQMVFCAPDKMELIGDACDVVLPVLRTSPENMEVGIVEMHK